MTNTTEDRVRLARLQGWEIVDGYTEPHGIAPEETMARDLPNPYTNPADRDAVVEWLRAQGHYVILHAYTSGGYEAEIRTSDGLFTTANYKLAKTAGEAVTRAALRALDEMEK